IWNGKIRRLHYFAETNPEQVEAYAPYIRNHFNYVDVYLFKAGEYGREWLQIENDAQGEPRRLTGDRRGLFSLLGPEGYIVSDTPVVLPSADVLARDFEEIQGVERYDRELLALQSEGAHFGTRWETRGNKCAVYIYRRRSASMEPGSLRHFVLPEQF